MSSATLLLSTTSKILKRRANGFAIIGVLIAIACILVATAAVAFIATGTLSIDAIQTAQQTNPALWSLDLMPFIFAFWGQYTGSMMAYEAGAVVFDQTSELRAQTSALEQKSMHEATHDSLTDLPNRALFLDRLGQGLENSRYDGSHLAILVMDLDHFKDINDTLGHHNGDGLLRQVATRLKGTVQAVDTVARLGGDEFAFIMHNIHSAVDAIAFSTTILDAMKTPFKMNGMQLEVSASIGLAIFPGHGEDANSLLKSADIAMYAAKQDKTGFALYSSENDKYTTRRLSLMGELRQAIDAGNLSLRYQPKLNLKTGELDSVEALVRWQHKVHGEVNPDEFIELAERTGLINPLTNWVVENAIQQAATWKNQGLNLNVAINISPSVLMDPLLHDTFTGLLAAYKVPAECIMLEITENALMEDRDRAVAVLDQFAKTGFSLAIDDFGTGYSSLAYINRLPVHELKIDKSFVQDMATNESNAVIVRATIDLAHNIGIKVVAEGVEDEATLHQLEELGCDVIQGYYISKPLTVENIPDMISLGNGLFNVSTTET
ncbi:MAG: EAL domain-containing protein [Gammaproteobacteria bacterium]